MRVDAGKRLPLAYVLRSLWVRKLGTVLTAGGMALVVFVFAAVLMMSAGIRSTLVATGEAGNVVVLRKGAGAEINSAITRDQAATIASLAGIAHDDAGRAMVVAETVVLNSLPKRAGGAPANITVRGTADLALALRPKVHMTQGRMFRPGTSEMIAGRAVARGFAQMDVGNSVHIAGRDWQVVGLFDAGGSGFDSEIWIDSQQALQAFRRNVYSSAVFALADGQRFDDTVRPLEADPRLGLEAKPELQFYAEQSEQLARFIRLLGLSLSVIFSIGAVAGAMITMFSAVATRIGEIGTLRALGFRRGAVLTAFLSESIALSLSGGVLGILLASGLRHLDIATTNIQTFSEIAFRFELTPQIFAAALSFALAMGVLGGFLPAWRASRMGIVDCLRAR